MVREYKRKTTMASYSKKRLQDAIAAVKGGQSMRGASKEYGTPKKNLMRHCRGDVARPGEVLLGRTRVLLDEELEKEIVAIVQRTEQQMYGLTARDLRRLAFTVAENS